MARMKTVFSTDKAVERIIDTKAQVETKDSRRTIWTDGDGIIYSYDTPVAMYDQLMDTWWISGYRWSNTTSRRLSDLFWRTQHRKAGTAIRMPDGIGLPVHRDMLLPMEQVRASADVCNNLNSLHSKLLSKYNSLIDSRVAFWNVAHQIDGIISAANAVARRWGTPTINPSLAPMTERFMSWFKNSDGCRREPLNTNSNNRWITPPPFSALMKKHFPHLEAEYEKTKTENADKVAQFVEDKKKWNAQRYARYDRRTMTEEPTLGTSPKIYYHVAWAGALCERYELSQRIKTLRPDHQWWLEAQWAAMSSRTNAAVPFNSVPEIQDRPASLQVPDYFEAHLKDPEDFCRLEIANLVGQGLPPFICGDVGNPYRPCPDNEENVIAAIQKRIDENEARAMFALRAAAYLSVPLSELSSPTLWQQRALILRLEDNKMLEVPNAKRYRD